MAAAQIAIRSGTPGEFAETQAHGRLVGTGPASSEAERRRPDLVAALAPCAAAALPTVDLDWFDPSFCRHGHQKPGGFLWVPLQLAGRTPTRWWARMCGAHPGSTPAATAPLAAKWVAACALAVAPSVTVEPLPVVREGARAAADRSIARGGVRPGSETERPSFTSRRSAGYRSWRNSPTPDMSSR